MPAINERAESGPVASLRIEHQQFILGVLCAAVRIHCIKVAPPAAGVRAETRFHRDPADSWLGVPREEPETRS